ncbi:adenylosuccinate synthase [bacterium]|nr:adenylosuccinate synthase [bacterium]
MNIVVLGAQWGDEGKGRIVDNLCHSARMIVRFLGGANAGHTVVIDGVSHKIHNLPSGILHPGMINIVGPTVACDLPVIQSELDVANRFGSTVFLDRSAPVVLNIHKTIDAGRENAAKGNAIGTTKRGIGPVFEDYWGRRGLRLGDLVSEARIAERLRTGGYYDEKLAVAKYLKTDLDFIQSFDEAVAWCLQFSEMLRPYLADTRMMVAEAARDGKDIIFEGAQGILLDTVHGSSPFTTSSTCTAAGVAQSFGIYRFERVIGVVKAYATRVGEGPFPTEQNNETGKLIAAKGCEVGTTTGRSRKVGWLDLPALRYACRVGGVTELMLTKADVLSGIAEIPVCTSYEFEGKPVGGLETLTTRVMREAKLEYQTLPGWNGDLGQCSSYKDLPESLKNYIAIVSQFTRLPTTAVTVGAERSAILYTNGNGKK